MNYIEDVHFKTVGEAEPGTTVKLGKRKYIVLYHSDGNTALVSQKIVFYSIFGESDDYETSLLRKRLNTDFYLELVDAVGRDNIVPHVVNLIDYGGEVSDKVVTDNVSVPSVWMCNEFSNIIPCLPETWWTVTKSGSALNYWRKTGTIRTMYKLDVNSETVSGCYAEPGTSNGVRPFFVVKSTTPLPENPELIKDYDVDKAEQLILGEMKCSKSDARRLAERIDYLHPYLFGYIKKWLNGYRENVEFYYKDAMVSTYKIMSREQCCYIMALYRLSVLIENPHLIENYLRHYRTIIQ